MPRELVATGIGQVELRLFESLPLGPHDLRVRTAYAAAKHGTEMSFFQGYGLHRGVYDSEYRIFRARQEGFHFPLPVGNTAVGQVIELGDAVTGFVLDDTVFAYGPFREEHVWPAHQVRHLPDGVPWQAACCLDPADFAVGAVRDGHVRLGDTVAVFGMGAIGLCVLQVLQAAGAHRVIAVEPIGNRRDTALALGADEVLDPTAVDVGLAIREMTGRCGADVCIEYSGHHLALNQAIRAVAYGGTVVAGAFPGAYPAGVDFGSEAHYNRVHIVFSRACSEPNPDFPNWDESRLQEVAWRLLAQGRINAQAIVQPIVPFEELAAAYPRIATDPENHLKLGAEFLQNPS